MKSQIVMAIMSVLGKGLFDFYVFYSFFPPITRSTLKFFL